MKKIKVAVLFLAASIFTNIVGAQSIDEGKKFLYYEKYISAKNVFEKLLAANANNTDAAYWLGQTLLSGDDANVAAAKAVYQKTLAANSNNALLTAGMGHIELLEGKTQDARNRFETAISLSQGKNIPVLNAIGLANGNFNIKNGDGAYAVEKLKQATTIKGFKDPETWCLLGDAYRKLIDGGNAITSYQSALTLNPAYARAKYRIGKVYQTQGPTQKDIYMPYFNDAIALDANYAPVYNNLFNLFYYTDVNKASEYLDKYLNIMGADEPKACSYRVSVTYAQGLNQEAITKADQCIAAAGGNPYFKLYGIKGYAYNNLKDSVKAKEAFELFFKNAKEDQIGSTDLKTYADILLKFPGNEVLAGTYVDKAVIADTTEAGKVALLKSMAANYEAQKNYAAAAEWYKKVLDVKKSPSKTDIYNVANNYSRSGNYQASIDNWSMYTTKFPGETYGYYMTAITQTKIDTVMAMGLAVPSYQKVTEIGESLWATDSAKVKVHLLNAYKYLIQYTYNIKKDKKGASDFCAKYLAKEPTDAEVLGFKKVFDTPGAIRSTPAPSQTPAARPAGGTKPATGTKPAAATAKPPAPKKK
jgi:Tfp pilus assembly protein PilF